MQLQPPSLAGLASLQKPSSASASTEAVSILKYYNLASKQQKVPRASAPVRCLNLSHRFGRAIFCFLLFCSCIIHKHPPPTTELWLLDPENKALIFNKALLTFIFIYFLGRRVHRVPCLCRMSNACGWHWHVHVADTRKIRGNFAFCKGNARKEKIQLHYKK